MVRWKNRSVASPRYVDGKECLAELCAGKGPEFEGAVIALFHLLISRTGVLGGLLGPRRWPWAAAGAFGLGQERQNHRVERSFLPADRSKHYLTLRNSCQTERYSRLLWSAAGFYCCTC